MKIGSQETNTGARVSLVFYPEITGRIRYIQRGLENPWDHSVYDCAHVYWDDGLTSYCPLDRLNILPYYAPEAGYFPWEKPPEENKTEVVTKTNEELDITVAEANAELIARREEVLKKWGIKRPIKV